MHDARIGFNHNIMHNSRVYHVQTEDSGTSKAHIITHLFVGGNIINSKKSSYASVLEKDIDEESMDKEIRSMMKEQHKEMMKELKRGKFDHIGERKSEGTLLTPDLIKTSSKATAEAGGAPEAPPVPEAPPTVAAPPPPVADIPSVAPPSTPQVATSPSSIAPSGPDTIPDMKAFDEEAHKATERKLSRDRPSFRSNRPPRPQFGRTEDDAAESKPGKRPSLGTSGASGRSLADRRRRPKLELRGKPSGVTRSPLDDRKRPPNPQVQQAAREVLTESPRDNKASQSDDDKKEDWPVRAVASAAHNPPALSALGLPTSPPSQNEPLRQATQRFLRDEDTK